MAAITMQRSSKSTKDVAKQALRDRQVNAVSLTVFFVFAVVAVIVAIVMDTAGIKDDRIALVSIGIMLVGFYILFALKIANQWEKAVMLRFGKFIGLRGPGLFWMVPVVDSISTWIDHRVMVTPFSAEKTLTKEATQLMWTSRGFRKKRRVGGLFRPA